MGMLGLNGSNTIKTSNTRNTMDHRPVRNITSSMDMLSNSSLVLHLICHIPQLRRPCLRRIIILIMPRKVINSHNMGHNNLLSNFNLLINNLLMVIVCHHISNHHSSGRDLHSLGHRNHQALTLAAVAVVVLLMVVEVMMLP
jgi:hypothetical protein